MIVSSTSSQNGRNIGDSTRERMQIIADILSQCTLYRKKSYIMEKANLNLEDTESCLRNLFCAGLVQIGISSQGCLIYKVTEKGRDILEYYYYMMQEFLEYHKLVVGQIREDYVDTVKRTP
ncbi:MAG TPA: winged helix-turn-helix domain-containing protein [Nitrososphaeraceae archaeon]|nr:winged helix-turn-helix domain-containing protein [Nitrososphaeraceae archaeon]